MKEVAVVAYCRIGIARAVRGALNQTHGIPMTAHVLRHAVERAGVASAEAKILLAHMTVQIPSGTLPAARGFEGLR
jgi:acetyl-CoA acetyltransferase